MELKTDAFATRMHNQSRLALPPRLWHSKLWFYIYLCSSLMFQKIKEIDWHGHFSGKVIHRIYYNHCEKLGIKGSPRKVHVFIHCKNDNENYRISTNSSKYQLIHKILSYFYGKGCLTKHVLNILNFYQKKERRFNFILLTSNSLKCKSY